tara:strand:- start:21 stop:608 length:588 start_codon:yes stop_codon:yes gene_type:complete
MIPKLITLGIETILKIICEKVIIREIQIVNKNNKFNGIIDELEIKAESIIFNKINISNINIKTKDVVLNFALNNEKFFIDNCDALINMRLTTDNINKTLFNNKWERLKNSIESFISMRFKHIEINNKSIYFVTSDGLTNKNINYILQYDKNCILLVNNINQDKLVLLNDENISIKNIFLCESYIELELSSKIIFN